MQLGRGGDATSIHGWMSDHKGQIHVLEHASTTKTCPAHGQPVCSTRRNWSRAGNAEAVGPVALSAHAHSFFHASTSAGPAKLH